MTSGREDRGACISCAGGQRAGRGSGAVRLGHGCGVRFYSSSKGVGRQRPHLEHRKGWEMISFNFVKISLAVCVEEGMWEPWAEMGALVCDLHEGRGWSG